MTDKATDVTVTQADRDAADEHYPPHLWKKAARDDLAIAFARHRAAQSGEGRSNGAREIEQAARAIQAKYQETHDDTFLPIEVCREYALAALSKYRTDGGV